jgi:hypothetical protein
MGFWGLAGRKENVGFCGIKSQQEAQKQGFGHMIIYDKHL